MDGGKIIAYVIAAVALVLILNFMLHVDLLSLLVGIALGYFGAKYFPKKGN